MRTGVLSLAGARARVPDGRSRIPLVLLGVLASGCGYSLGYRAPPSVQTVAVPIFNNETFPLWREVEYELTSALRTEIQSRTSLELVSEKQADMVIFGTLRQFRERVIAEGRSDQKTESSLFAEVSVVVEDHKNGTRWQERVRVVEPFSLQSGETIDAARKRAIKDLAERILLAVESWDEAE